MAKTYPARHRFCTQLIEDALNLPPGATLRLHRRIRIVLEGFDLHVSFAYGGEENRDMQQYLSEYGRTCPKFVNVDPRRLGNEDVFYASLEEQDPGEYRPPT